MVRGTIAAPLVFKVKKCHIIDIGLVVLLWTHFVLPTCSKVRAGDIWNTNQTWHYFSSSQQTMEAQWLVELIRV